MDEQPAVLFFSGETPTSRELRSRLVASGLRVLQTDQPAEALEHLMDEPVGVILLDGPSLTVFSERLFRQWREQHPLVEAVGIAGTPEGTDPALVRMDCAALVRPPVDPARVADAVHDALGRRARRVELVGGQEEVASRVLQAIQALVTAVELKDSYTLGRADRVALFSGILADELGDVDVDRIRTAARIMDVGKTGIPEQVLNKTERLDDEEYEEIKRHPIISWEMLRHFFDDSVVLGVARHHHERWDGQGYPDGLEQEEIPLEARIVAVADSLDAITSTRAFRKARLWSEAVQEVMEGSGSRYDPRVIEVLSRAQDRMLVGA
jgi:HD-GYP domain-containing protein (c-di-GMP phosphodiesterase class II)